MLSTIHTQTHALVNTSTHACIHTTLLYMTNNASIHSHYTYINMYIHNGIHATEYYPAWWHPMYAYTHTCKHNVVNEHMSIVHNRYMHTHALACTHIFRTHIHAHTHIHMWNEIKTEIYKRKYYFVVLNEWWMTVKELE